jgi:hypothetical protein
MKIRLVVLDFLHAERYGKVERRISTSFRCDHTETSDYINLPFKDKGTVSVLNPLSITAGIRIG